MAIGYRVYFESFDLESKEILQRETIIDDILNKPTNNLDFSIEYDKQINILEKTLDNIINAKGSLINKNIQSCPKCDGKMIKIGKNKSVFHDVLTDHMVSIQRCRCKDCRYEPPSTTREILNSVQSADLARVQTELGALHTFRETENILNTFSTEERDINNRTRIKETVATMADAVNEVDKEEKELVAIPAAEELVMNVDGGHVNTIEDQRSIEALTSVIYRPEALKPNKQG